MAAVRVSQAAPAFGENAAGAPRVPAPSSPVDRRLGAAWVALVGCDLLGVVAAGLLAGAPLARSPWMVPALPAWAALLAAYGLYPRPLRTAPRLPSLAHAMLAGCLITGLAADAAGQRVGMASLAIFAIAAGTLILAARTALRPVLSAVVRPERVLVLGDRAQAEQFAGATHDEARIDHVVVGPGLDDDALLRLAMTAADRSVRLSLLVPGGDTVGRMGPVEHVAGLPVLRLHASAPGRCARGAKRAVDVAVAALALVLLALPALLIVVVIRADSAGPAFFRQLRVGRHGQRFLMWKFRTMVVDAERQAAELRRFSRDPDWLDLEFDPRITRVGRLLRWWSLDEVPQLWNVLRGEMSLVGPRPLTPEDHDRLPAWAAVRDEVPPGLTGLWQVSGRAAVPFEQMVRLDGRYLVNWSLRRDMAILLHTVPAVLSHRGAN